MRRTRFFAAALALLTLASCGSKSASTDASPAPSVTSPSPSPGVTVDLGGDPRVAAVERLLSASKGKFDAQLFLSAFDAGSQPCDLAAVVHRLDGHTTQPPLDVNAARLVSVHSTGANGAVELTDTHPFYVRLRRVNGTWLVDDNACLWVAEAEGGDLPARITKGLATLPDGDPRSAPAADLVASLTGHFDAARFLSAFDLSDQPCDPHALARAVADDATGAGTPPKMTYFLRPMGHGEAAVLATSQGQTVPLRVHERDGKWLLDEDACTWLTLLGGVQSSAQGNAVQSDLRNALTAEKTLYTDSQSYSAEFPALRMIEPSLDWGNRLQVAVADASEPGDRNVVCMAESSPSGQTYAIADIAVGPTAGTYYGAQRCPAPLTAAAVARMADHF
jgi:hypothetical protein